jgi:long-chain acyl-CoA synthetase
MEKKAQNKDTLKSDFIFSLEGLTTPQTLAGNVGRFGADAPSMREKTLGIWQSYSWKEYLGYVKCVCLGLISIGFKRGETVALIIDNRPEWLFTELGAQAAGAVTVNLFTSTMARELVYDLNLVNASFIFVENRRQADKILSHRESLPNLRRVLFIDPVNMIEFQDEPWFLSFSQLVELGKGIEKEEPERFDGELWSGRPEDEAMILMTSGTKGIPKPAMVSYKNLISMARNWLEKIPMGVDDNWVSLSPCAGIIEETWCAVMAPACGMIINFPETYETRMNDMREIGPSVILNYPGFWEGLMSMIKSDLEGSGPLRRLLWRRSFHAYKTIDDRKHKGNAISLSLKFLKVFYRWIIVRPLLDRLGLLGVRHAYSGGYPISPEVIRFFRFNGLNLKQCYGLAETSGMFQFQDDNDISADTLGIPPPGADVKITPDNEIAISGKFVFSGYYQDREATSEVLKDGILYTGDIGGIDADGRLFIAGRREDIIETEPGRMFSRDFIETRIKESPFIKEAVIWGKEKPYLIAFLSIDFKNVMSWSKRHNITCHGYDELTRHTVIEELIGKEIQGLNSRLPEKLRVRKFILINKELDTDEELTKTGIARRKFLFEQYRDVLNAMYADKQEAYMIGRLRDVNDEIRTIKTRIKIITVPEGE